MHRLQKSPIAAVLCLATLAAWPAAAQFQDLATNGDGSVLYFSSPIRQKGTSQTFHSKIFRWDAVGGIRVAAEVQSEGQPGCATNSFYQLQSPQISADGTVLAYTASRPVSGGICSPAETNQGIIELPGRQVRLDGRIALSTNARYAITTPLAAVTDNFHVVTDLASGISTAVAGAFDGSGRRVTDEATIVTRQPSAVIVTDRHGGTRVVQTNSEVDDVIIGRPGNAIVYVTNMAPVVGGSTQPSRISSIDLTTGRETQLFTGFSVRDPSLTSDGATVFFTDRQLYAIGIDGGGLHQVAGGFSGVAVSGDGLVAYADAGGLTRIDLTSGKITELTADPPFVTAAYRTFPAAMTTIAAVGSVLDLVGGGLGATRQLTFCGRPVPFKLVNTGIAMLQFQVPWDAPVGTCQAVVQSDSPFEHGIDLEVQAFDPQYAGYPSGFLHHADFSGVTQAAPAHPGESIVTYMTGLGPVDSTGQVTRPGFTCYFDGVAGGIVYAGLAPGFAGFYQVNVSVPNVSPRAAALSCGWGAAMDLPSLFATTTVWIG